MQPIPELSFLSPKTKKRSIKTLFPPHIAGVVISLISLQVVISLQGRLPAVSSAVINHGGELMQAAK